MSDSIQELEKGGNMFQYDFDSVQDRESMFKFKILLHHLLMKNPVGIFKKTILEGGLKLWQADRGQHFTKARGPTFLKDQAYMLQTMLLNIKSTAKNTKSGARLPQWLRELVSLLQEGGADSSAEEA